MGQICIHVRRFNRILQDTMFRVKTGRSSWVVLAIVLWLLSSEAACLRGNNSRDLGFKGPIESPMDLEDTHGESESENEREFDDDNLFDEKVMAFDVNVIRKTSAGSWAMLHESPVSKLNSPPPKRS